MSLTLGGAAARVRLAASQFQILGGMRRASSDCISSTTSGGGVGRKGSLYLLTEPRSNLTLGLEACQVVHDVFAREFYADPSPSLTTSLNHALSRANTALLQHNRMADSRDRASVGLTCAVVRADEVYLAQLPPSQALIVHRGNVRAFPPPRNWPGEAVNPYPPSSLGSSTADPDPDFVRSPLEAGDAVILCSANLAALLTPAEADHHLVGADHYQIIDYLYGLAEQNGLMEGYAVAICATTDTRGLTPAAGLRLPGRGNTGPHAAEQRGNTGGFFSRKKVEQNAPLPEPIPLRRKRPEPHVIFDHTDADEPDGEFSATIVAPPPRQPHIDNLLAARRDFEDRAAMLHSNNGEADDLSPMPRPLLRVDYEVSRPRPIIEPDADEDAAMFTATTPVAYDYSSDEPAPLTKQPAASVGKGLAAMLGGRLQQAGRAALPAVQGLASRLRRQPAAAELPSSHEDSSNLPSLRAAEGSGVGEHGGTSSAAARPRITGTIVLDDEPEEQPATSQRGLSLGALRSVAGRLRHQSSGKTGAVAVTTSASASYAHVDDEAYNAHRRRIPLWVFAATLLVIVALLAFFVTQGMAARKSQEVSDHLRRASVALNSAEGSKDAEANRTYLKAAGDSIAAASALDPTNPDVATARRWMQTALDSTNLVTRFGDLTTIFDLTAAAANSPTSFLSQVIVAGEDIYLLDRGGSVLYRCKADGSEPTAILSANDGLVKGKLLYITWRVDRLVALDDSYTTYVYDPGNGASAAVPLAAANNFNRPLDLASFDGNLYILGARSNQIVKYAVGSYNLPPSDWFAGDPAVLNGASKLAVNGDVYVLTSSGSVLHLAGRQLKERSDLNAGPQAVAPAAAALRGLFTSPDSQYLYAVDAHGGAQAGEAGRIFQLDLSGRLLRQYMTAEDSDALLDLNSIFVKPDDSTIYLLTNNRLYRATLTAAPATAPTTGPPASQPAVVAPQPTVKATPIP